MLQPSAIVETEQQRSDHVPFPFLCQRNPATTQSAVRTCFTLNMAVCQVVDPLLRFGDDAVEAGALESREPFRGKGDIGGRRCNVDGRFEPARACSSSTAPLAFAAPPRRSRPSAPRIKHHERRGRFLRQLRDAGAAGCRRSFSASSPERAAWQSRSRHRHAPIGQRRQQRVVRSGK